MHPYNPLGSNKCHSTRAEALKDRMLPAQCRRSLPSTHMHACISAVLARLKAAVGTAALAVPHPQYSSHSLVP